VRAIERVKHFFIDYIGIALHATTLETPGRDAGSTRSDPCALHGSGQWHGGHSMELDDTYLPGSIHNESFVFSPSLALAEERGTGGKRFVTAIVADLKSPAALPRQRSRR
jgi:2-methylcitrate dehydratase PrpD